MYKAFVRAKADNNITKRFIFLFLVDMKKADIKNSVLEYLPILTS